MVTLPCPTPHKLRWPLDDEWGPWQKMTEINLMEHRTGARRYVEVYRCRDVGDHVHLRTAGKRAWRRAEEAPEEEKNRRAVQERRRDKRQRRDLAKFVKDRRGRRQR